MTDQENQRRGLYDGPQLSTVVVTAMTTMTVAAFILWALERAGRCPCCGVRRKA